MIFFFAEQAKNYVDDVNGICGLQSVGLCLQDRTSRRIRHGMISEGTIPTWLFMRMNFSIGDHQGYAPRLAELMASCHRHAEENQT